MSPGKYSVTIRGKRKVGRELMMIALRSDADGLKSGISSPLPKIWRILLDSITQLEDSIPMIMRRLANYLSRRFRTKFSVRLYFTLSAHTIP